MMGYHRAPLIPNRNEKMAALLAVFVKDEEASQFLRGFFTAFQWYDDLVDGDTDVDRTTKYGFLQYTLYELPANPFFNRNKAVLLPVIRKILADWQAATDMEIAARESPDDADAQRMLVVSYEMRNGFFDVATVVVDLLYGNVVRDKFMARWIKLTRFSQSLESYVEKVTAASRPMKAEYQSTAELACKDWFSTTIYDQKLSLELAPMHAAIKDEQERDPEGLNRSNVRPSGAWHSAELSMHKWPVFAPLVEAIFAAMEDVAAEHCYAKKIPLVITGMWANVLPAGGHSRLHPHPNSLWSRVFYIASSRGTGNIAFYDPRPQALALQGVVEDVDTLTEKFHTRVKYTPTANRMLLFPGYLGHEVEPHRAETERVSVSFNVCQRLQWS